MLNILIERMIKEEDWGNMSNLKVMAIYVELFRYMLRCLGNGVQLMGLVRTFIDPDNMMAVSVKLLVLM